MQLLSTLLLAPLLVSAAPTEKLAARQSGLNNPSYVWSVTNWNAGCQRHGCYYDFNISAPAFPGTPSIPAFSAYCHGLEAGAFGAGSPVTLCTPLEEDGGAGHAVAAKLLPFNTTDPIDGAHMVFSLKFDVGEGAYYNYTAYATEAFNQFVAPPQNFTVMPSEAWGVA